MIELNQFISNSTSVLESADKAQKSFDTALLVNSNEIEENDDQSVDLNSFVLLMAQMLPSMPNKAGENLNSSELVREEELAQKVVEDSNELLDVGSDSAEHLKSNQQTIALLDKLSAMAWINSENYQPAQPIANDNQLETNQQSSEFLDSSLINIENKTIKTTDDLTHAIEVTLPMFNANQTSSLVEDEGVVEDADDSVLLDAELSAPQKQAINKSQRLPGLIEQQADKRLSGASEAVELDDSPLEQSKVKIDLLKQHVVQNNNNSQDANELNSIIHQKDEHIDRASLMKEIASSFELTPTHTVTGLNVEPNLNNVSFNNSHAYVDTSVSMQLIKSDEPLPIMSKSLDIPVDINNEQWADQFSERVVWLGQRGIQSAIINIHPEDLGPLEINVKVVDNMASITIASNSSHVREMVDQALPQLREMMAEQGLNLSDVSIESEGKSGQSSQRRDDADRELVAPVDDEIQFTPIIRKPSKGLVDYFA